MQLLATWTTEKLRTPLVPATADNTAPLKSQGLWVESQDPKQWLYSWKSDASFRLMYRFARSYIIWLWVLNDLSVFIHTTVTFVQIPLYLIWISMISITYNTQTGECASAGFWLCTQNVWIQLCQYHHFTIRFKSKNSFTSSTLPMFVVSK